VLAKRPSAPGGTARQDHPTPPPSRRDKRRPRAHPAPSKAGTSAASAPSTTSSEPTTARAAGSATPRQRRRVTRTSNATQFSGTGPRTFGTVTIPYVETMRWQATPHQSFVVGASTGVLVRSTVGSGTVPVAPETLTGVRVSTSGPWRISLTRRAAGVPRPPATTGARAATPQIFTGSGSRRLGVVHVRSAATLAWTDADGEFRLLVNAAPVIASTDRHGTLKVSAGTYAAIQVRGTGTWRIIIR
jgi:hypothetical protein